MGPFVGGRLTRRRVNYWSVQRGIYRGREDRLVRRLLRLCDRNCPTICTTLAALLMRYERHKSNGLPMWQLTGRRRWSGRHSFCELWWPRTGRGQWSSASECRVWRRALVKPIPIPIAKFQTLAGWVRNDIRNDGGKNAWLNENAFQKTSERSGKWTVVVASDHVSGVDLHGRRPGNQAP